MWQADSRLVREASVPMAAFAASTDRIKIGSGVIDVWSRNPARLASMFSTLDDLAPGRILCGLGAWWDPLAAKVGIDRAKPLTVMREVVHGRATVARQRERHVPRRVRPRRRHRARLRLPGTTRQGRADLHRGDRHEDDGADRRDRRRRRAQLPRLTRLQRAGARRARGRRRRAAAAASTTSIGRSSSSARCTRTGRPRSTWHATW